MWLVAVWNTISRMCITPCMLTSIGITSRSKVLPSESPVLNGIQSIAMYACFDRPFFMVSGSSRNRVWKKESMLRS